MTRRLPQWAPPVLHRLGVDCDSAVATDARTTVAAVRSLRTRLGIVAEPDPAWSTRKDARTGLRTSWAWEGRWRAIGLLGLRHPWTRLPTWLAAHRRRLGVDTDTAVARDLGWSVDDIRRIRLRAGIERRVKPRLYASAATVWLTWSPPDWQGTGARADDLDLLAMLREL